MKSEIHIQQQELLREDNQSPNKEYMFIIDKYTKNCEEHNQFHECYYIKRSYYKILILVILTILSLGTIFIFLSKYSNLNLYFIYSYTYHDKATHVYLIDKQMKSYIIKMNRVNNEKEVTFFSFKLLQYIKQSSNIFTSIEIGLTKSLTNEEFHIQFSSGLSSSIANERSLIFESSSSNDFKISSFWKLLLYELFDSIYLFLIFSIVFWILALEYYSFSFILLFLTIVSLFYSAYEARKINIKINSICNNEFEVKVIRDGKEMNILSSQLVPGDVYIIPDKNMNIPADSYLLTETVIINEALLNGESCAIVKESLPNDNYPFRTDDKLYILYAGSLVLESRNNPKAVVFSTGFATDKGTLIRSILYPKEYISKLKNQIFKFCLFMMIFSCYGFIFDVISFLKFGFSVQIIVYLLNNITMLFPPILPLVLIINTHVSGNSLKKNEINCLERKKIKQAGSINMIIFDKTGTITKDKLEIVGVLQNTLNNSCFILRSKYDKQNIKKIAGKVYENIKKKKENSKSSSEEYVNLDDIQFHILQEDTLEFQYKKQFLNRLFTECLSTCHSVRIVKNQKVGDPIDLEMFDMMNWKMIDYGHKNISYMYNDESTVEEKIYFQSSSRKEDILKRHYELESIVSYSFSSKKQRNTVVLRNKYENDGLYLVFSKGSPEKISQLCIKETIPSNYDEELLKLTSSGFRLIAFAGKVIKTDAEDDETFMNNYSDRSLIENKLIFLGFIVIENKIRETSKEVISLLNQSKFKLAMSTGDNILTASSIAKDCGLIDSSMEIFYFDLLNLNNNKKYIQCTRLSNILLSVEGEKEVNNKLIQDNYSNDDEEFEVMSRRRSSLAYEIPIYEVSREKKDSLLFMENYNKIRRYYQFLEIQDQSNENNNYRSKKGKNIFTVKNLRVVNKDNSFNYNKKQSQSSISLINNSYSNEYLSQDEDFLFLENEFNPSNVNYIIAINGSSFSTIFKYANDYVRSKSKENLKYFEILRLILNKGKIFGRMNAEDKRHLVEAFQKEDFNVMMIGDGINDCEALKIANIGVSLNNDYLIYSTFSFDNSDLNNILTILKEGRINMNSYIDFYKYIVLYSIIQFNISCIFKLINVIIPNSHYIIYDMFLSMIILILSTFTKRTSNFNFLFDSDLRLINFSFIFSSIIHILLIILFQYLLLLLIIHKEEYDEYECRRIPIFECKITTSYFLLAVFQHIISLVILNRKNKVREPFYTNRVLLIYIIGVVFTSFLVLFYRNKEIEYVFQIYQFERYSFNFYIVVLLLIHIVISLLVDVLLVEKMISYWERRKMSIYQNEYKKNEKFNRMSLCRMHRFQIDLISV